MKRNNIWVVHQVMDGKEWPLMEYCNRRKRQADLAKKMLDGIYPGCVFVVRKYVLQ